MLRIGKECGNPLFEGKPQRLDTRRPIYDKLHIVMKAKSELRGIQFKLCNKCKAEKPVSDFYWITPSKRKAGWSARCKNCCIKATLESRVKYQDKYTQYEKERYAANPEIHKERAAKWRKLNTSKVLLSNNKVRYSRYGITQEDAERMLKQQNGKCAICGLLFKDMAQIHIDHDQTCCKDRRKACGKCVRGLLCSNCNTGIGLLKESKEIMLAAIEYLKREE